MQHQLVSSLSYRYWSLRIVPQRETRNAKHRRLFLEAARVRDNRASARGQTEHFQIAHWVQLDHFAQSNPQSGYTRLSARMHGKDYGVLLRELSQSAADRCNPNVVV